MDDSDCSTDSFYEFLHGPDRVYYSKKKRLSQLVKKQNRDNKIKDKKRKSDSQRKSNNLLKKQRCEFKSIRSYQYESDDDVASKNPIVRRRIASKSMFLVQQDVDTSEESDESAVARYQKEGITYESSTTFPKTVSQDTLDIDSNCVLIFFDLETSGFAREDEILQIAARAKSRSFNVYILPTKEISKGASNVTGLNMYEGDLYLRSRLLPAVSSRKASLAFIKYLRSFRKKALLMAHNGFRFDVPRIMNLMSKLDLLEEFKSVVAGFADSLEIFKKLLPNRVAKREHFSMDSLTEDFLNYKYDYAPHNAVTDVERLRHLSRIIIKKNICITENSKSIERVIAEEDAKAKARINKATLYEYSASISDSMMTKMSEAGINKRVLTEAFENGGLEGITILLSEKVNGKPRVTNDKKVLDRIYKLFPRPRHIPNIFST